jgi:hypothetical protein
VKEVRAWTVRKGATAPQAAGVIHTDFEKGFIRAETIAYDDFIKYKGEAGAKEAGACAWKARNTASRKATSCTSASTSDQSASGIPDPPLKKPPLGGFLLRVVFQPIMKPAFG